MLNYINRNVNGSLTLEQQVNSFRIQICQPDINLSSLTVVIKSQILIKRHTWHATIGQRQVEAVVVVVLRMTSLGSCFFLQRGYQYRVQERNECLIYEFDNVRTMLMDMIYEAWLSRIILFALILYSNFVQFITALSINIDDLGDRFSTWFAGAGNVSVVS